MEFKSDIQFFSMLDVIDYFAENYVRHSDVLLLGLKVEDELGDIDLPKKRTILYISYHYDSILSLYSIFGDGFHFGVTLISVHAYSFFNLSLTLS